MHRFSAGPTERIIMPAGSLVDRTDLKVLCYCLRSAAFLLNSCFLLTQAQDIPVKLDPKWPLRGQTATLIPAGKPEIITCTWFRDEQVESKEIFTYIPSISDQENGPAFTGRETAGPNCSLAISRLTLNDTGIYIVRKTVRGGPEIGRAHVQVSESASALGAGAISGIVLGSLALASLAGTLLYSFFRK
ncbi:carcinoembryonic antigen-related cell adhesion molecule 16-like [Sphaerodactylus townsendi]|uniref:carcinoembryonic antigen-related cell adhesion molecule 16-like n=1 Tax=Sphaerodactylus townsendi TaxID=933632 RepID=UPI002026BB8A|nr:carcinoembryonic antigen-related cell adhesion molecule 16-like [Sphaerodactylus townsendi]